MKDGKGGPTLSDKQARADGMSSVAELEFDALHAAVYDAMLDHDLPTAQGVELVGAMKQAALTAAKKWTNERKVG